MTSHERREWLEGRRQGIGSSDVAAILGLSPWQTALDIYLSKVKPPVEEKMAAPLEWGQRAEPMIAAAIRDHYGWTLNKIPTVIHRQHRFLIASVDRLGPENSVVEIKTASRADGWGEAETAEVPDYYWVQVQHQLEVLRETYEAKTAWVFVLIAGNDFRRYRVAYDPDYLPTVLDALRDFWACVETRTPPEPQWGHPSTLSAVQRLYEPKPGATTILPGECDQWADSYERLGQEAKAANEERDAVKARLIHALGDCEVGKLLDGRTVTRKEIKRAGFTVEPTTYFSFTVKSPKKGKVTS